jgi:endonuclease/exonuclease/phosphatase (EEP) superfamily protein YafD
VKFINPFAVQFLINLIAGGAAVATVLSFFSGWWVFALLQHFRVQYFGLLLVGLLLGLLQRHSSKALVGVWLVALVVNGFLIAPVLIKPKPGLSATEPVSLQVLHVSLDHNNPNIQPAIDYIQQQHSDIVSVLEVTPQALAQLLASLTEYEQVIAEPRTNSHGSVWLILRRPTQPMTVQAAALIHLPADSDRPLLQIDLTYAQRPLTLLCFHAIRPRSAGTLRYQQVEFAALADWSRIMQAKQRQVIAIGDFNSTPWYGSFRELLRNGDWLNSQNGFGLQPTWHGRTPALLRLPIDHCLHSSALQVTQRQTGPDVGSDHLPIQVKFSL